MVGNHADGHIGVVIFAVFHMGQAAHIIQNMTDRVHFKKIVDTLHNGGQTFKSHARVDVRMVQGCVIVIFVPVKLGKDQVPEFFITVAIASRRAVGFTASVFFPAIIENFGAGAAGAGAVFPEIVFFSQTGNVIFRYAHHIMPQVVGFIIVMVDGHIKLFGIELHHFRAEFPGPGNDFFFEIITEGKISQHFKKCPVAGGFADVVDIRCTDTFLAGCHPFARRHFIPRKEGFHRRHPGIDQKQTLVVNRH